MILTAVPTAKYIVIRDMTSCDNNLLNISLLCKIAGVSRSGYYGWLDAEETRRQREKEDERDFAIILEAYKFRGYNKGQRGIHMRLLHLSPPVIMNRKKIARLMDKYNLFCPTRKPNPYRKLEKELRTSKVQPNILNREFKAHGARTILLTDITYIRRGEGKFSYLCVIMDAFTSEILAYAHSWSLEVDFVLETVEMLMRNHGHELKTDALIHSDQGCHYTSHKFSEITKSYELRHSMSRKANCWDNAPQESFFGHMKDDILIPSNATHAEISRRIEDWIDYYNRDRPQWSLAKLTPSEFYLYCTTGVYPLAVLPPKDMAEDIEKSVSDKVTDVTITTRKGGETP